MAKNQPPKDYEELIRSIHDRYEDMSKSYKGIALYVTQNPNEVAVLPVSAIAEICGIHGSSFVRFAQSLGYSGFKELQTLFQKRLSTAAPGFEARVRALELELNASSNQNEVNFVRDLAVRDIASLQDLAGTVGADDLARAADIIISADVVYLVGQLRSAPVVVLMQYVLTMLGIRCILLDSSGGLATHIGRTMRKTDVLIAVSFRFYATEVVNIVEEAVASAIPVIAITDSTLSPLAKKAAVLFPVPERDYSFSRSLAAPMCLAQGLALSVAARVQKNAEAPRIPTVTGA